MSKHRVLLDAKRENHAQPLLNDAGIKTDVVHLTTGNLISLLQANPYDALIVPESVHIPLEVMETAPLSLKITGVLGDSPRNLNLMEATACGILVKITEYGYCLFLVSSVPNKWSGLFIRHVIRQGMR